MLSQVFAAIIRGPAAVRALLNNQTITAAGDSMVARWGLTRTTPGAIAACAVIVCDYIISDLIVMKMKANIPYRHDLRFRLIMSSSRTGYQHGLITKAYSINTPSISLMA